MNTKKSNIFKVRVRHKPKGDYRDILEPNDEMVLSLLKVYEKAISDMHGKKLRDYMKKEEKGTVNSIFVPIYEEYKENPEKHKGPESVAVYNLLDEIEKKRNRLKLPTLEELARETIKGKKLEKYMSEREKSVYEQKSKGGTIRKRRIRSSKIRKHTLSKNDVK
jgi:hypothetical protein